MLYSAPSYEDLQQGIHLDEDGKIRIEVPDDLADLWETLPAIYEGPTAQQPSPNPPTLPEEQPPSVPHLNLLMLVVGSRGDVQPFMALAAALIKYGHRVRLATHGAFAPFVQSKGIEFFDLGGCPKDLMAYMVQNPGLLPRFAAWRGGDVLRNRRIMRDIINASWRACFEPGTRPPSRGSENAKSSSSKGRSATSKKTEPVPFVADAIIANPPAMAHVHCAEKLGIPLHIFFTMPWSPTAQMPHPLASITASTQQRGQLNKMSYLFVEGLIWQGLGSIINDFRYKVLQMDPIHPSRGASLLHSAKIPHTYAWSPTLLPKPSDWPDHIAISGYLSLESPEKYSPPHKLAEFLAAGKPPIYIGFGSIVVAEPLNLLDLAIRAAHATGNRVILATGWSSSRNENKRPTAISNTSYTPADTFILHEDCPHDWLFPQVSCVVHHGGAGTTAAGLKAGKPTVVVPFFGDQFFWGERVALAGAGPPPIPYARLTLESLAEAIRVALDSHTIERAAGIGAKLRSEDGVGVAVESFHSRLPRKGMGCHFLPTRAARWKHKQLDILLSTAAAAVLQRNRLVDLRDFKLHRTADLNIANGPWEPASGAAWAITELFLDSFQGMGEILAEVGHMPVLAYRLVEKISYHAKKEHHIQSEEAPSSPGATTPPPFAQQTAAAAALKAGPRSKLPGEYFLTGSLRIGKAAARAPGEFTAAMAHGAHQLPLAWGDKTVRPAARVTGIGSGLLGGCKELCWGVADGVSGIFVHPVVGLVKEGPAGLAKGMLTGVLGLPVKFFAAASGVVGYPLKGVDLALSRALKESATAAVEFQARLQGEYEYSRLPEAEKVEVVKRWHQLVGTT